MLKVSKILAILGIILIPLVYTKYTTYKLHSNPVVTTTYSIPKKQHTKTLDLPNKHNSTKHIVTKKPKTKEIHKHTWDSYESPHVF